MPVTTTSVEKRPCFDPSLSSDFLYFGYGPDTSRGPLDLRFIGDTDSEYYPLELDRWDFSKRSVTGDGATLVKASTEDGIDFINKNAARSGIKNEQWENIRDRCEAENEFDGRYTNTTVSISELDT